MASLMLKDCIMADTPQIHLSLSTIWDYLCRYSTKIDFGPYPKKQVVIGGKVSPEPSGETVEVARLDAVAARAAWEAFMQGDRQALNDPRLARAIVSLGYLMGRRTDILLPQAIDFGCWLGYVITGWSVGEGPESMVNYLESVAAKSACVKPGAEHSAWASDTFWGRYYPAAVWGVVTSLGGKERTASPSWVG
jgi:hypothetical protein